MFLRLESKAYIQLYKRLCFELALSSGVRSTLGTQLNPIRVSSWQGKGCEASSWPENCTAFKTRSWTFSHMFAVCSFCWRLSIDLVSFCALLLLRAWLASSLNRGFSWSVKSLGCPPSLRRGC